jgi:type VI secretion system secreted protein VgrG
LVEDALTRYFEEEARFVEAAKRGEEALKRGEYLTKSKSAKGFSGSREPDGGPFGRRPWSATNPDCAPGAQDGLFLTKARSQQTVRDGMTPDKIRICQRARSARILRNLPPLKLFASRKPARNKELRVVANVRFVARDVGPGPEGEHMRNVLLLPLTVLTLAAPAFGAINLGAAETFAVLGASTVTNTGGTKIQGNLGVSPGAAVVGFPPGKMMVGTIYAGDAVAARAQADLTTAYKTAAAMPCGSNITGQNLGGLTLTPGVYCFDTSAQLTGALVLDFQGGRHSTFVFQIGSTLTTASGATVSFVNGENCHHKRCSITWQVGSSATLGTSTNFSGDILAQASITLTTSVFLCGRALARTGAVTMDTDRVFYDGTLTPPGPVNVTGNVTGNGQIPVPSPNSTEPGATGTGRASFAFIADPAGKGTFFTYMNYVTGLRIYGPIGSVEVIAIHSDGSPKTVRFLGACHNSLPQCSFSATVERPGESGGIGQFGVAIAGQLVETRSLRFISIGQVQFH